MKICTKCKVEKLEINFRKYKKSKDGLSSSCSMCHSAASKQLYNKSSDRRKQIRLHDNALAKRNIEYIREYLKKKSCMDCNIEDIRVLQFDHVRGNKQFNISDGVRNRYSLKKLNEEIEKCEVVCANCHFIRTYERRLLKFNINADKP